MDVLSNPATAAKPLRVISGQFVAKATVNYPKWKRARDAALVLRGEAVVKPTLASLANTFRVSIPLIVKTGRLLDEHKRNKLHINGNGSGNGTAALSDSVVENMVAEIGPDRILPFIDPDRILAFLDRATQPQLQFPLQAAG
jgi:hypothetical protein